MPAQRGRGLGYRSRPGTALALCITEFSRESVLPMKRTRFTPSTDPTPTPPSPLLLFIQQAQQALVDQEPVEAEVAEAEVAIEPPTPKHAA